jgi:hypothetical protein
LRLKRRARARRRINGRLHGDDRPVLGRLDRLDRALGRIRRPTHLARFAAPRARGDTPRAALAKAHAHGAAHLVSWFVFRSTEDYGDPGVAARRREILTVFFDLFLVTGAAIVWGIIAAAIAAGVS